MAAHNNQILGLILAGGQGSRMGGEDKGLIKLKGQVLVKHTVDRLKPQCTELVVSANRNLNEYRKLNLKVLQDASPNDYQGPMAGIYSTLDYAKKTPYDLLLVSSCDTPNLPSDLGSRLLSGMSESGASSAVAYAENHQQNLHCLIERSLWKNLSEFFEEGGRALHQWHRRHSSIRVDFSNQSCEFQNINELSDLDDFVF